MSSPVAMIYDWDSQWAMEDSQGPRNKGLHYLEAMLKFYRGFRKQGVNVDVIDMTCDLDNYKVLALPMVYMFKEGFAESSCICGERRCSGDKLLVRNRR